MKGHSLHSLNGVFWRRFRKNKLAAAGGVVVVLMFFVAVFAPFISPHNPDDIDRKHVLEAPSLKHPLGTDDLGRDVLSRMMYGARISLAQAVAIAERQGSGKAMEASFDDESGGKWEVEVASGDRVATYAVDMTSGGVSAVRSAAMRKVSSSTESGASAPGPSSSSSTGAAGGVARDTCFCVCVCVCVVC